MQQHDRQLHPAARRQDRGREPLCAGGEDRFRQGHGEGRGLRHERQAPGHVGFWPFTGDYWIIELGGKYGYAMVSNPDRSHLWVLSRTPVMDEVRCARIIARLQERSFDTSGLVRPAQSGP